MPAESITLLPALGITTGRLMHLMVLRWGYSRVHEMHYLRQSFKSNAFVDSLKLHEGEYHTADRNLYLNLKV